MNEGRLWLSIRSFQGAQNRFANAELVPATLSDTKILFKPSCKFGINLIAEITDYDDSILLKQGFFLVSEHLYDMPVGSTFKFPLNDWNHYFVFKQLSTVGSWFKYLIIHKDLDAIYGSPNMRLDVPVSLHFDALDSSQTDALNSAQIDALDSAQIDALDSAQIDALDSAQPSPYVVDAQSSPQINDTSVSPDVPYTPMGRPASFLGRNSDIKLVLICASVVVITVVLTGYPSKGKASRQHFSHSKKLFKNRTAPSKFSKKQLP